MHVIYAAINWLFELMEEIELIYIFKEFDYAIYHHKVFDAMFKMEKDGILIFKKITLWMGGFQIVLCMIWTNYSQFKYTGIVELLSAAGLGVKGSVMKALKGRDTKESTYLHKFLLEALFQYKVEYFRSTLEQ